MNLFHGDIFKVSSTQKPYYILVLAISEKKQGCYIVRCDDSGIVSKDHNISYINSRHLTDGLSAERVSNISMKRNDVRNDKLHYVWYTLDRALMTYQDAAINAELSQLDARFKLFLDTASDHEIALFNKNEEANNHKHNNLFISFYADFYKIKAES